MQLAILSLTRKWMLGRVKRLKIYDLGPIKVILREKLTILRSGDETSAINAVDKQWTTPRRVFGGFCILDPSNLSLTFHYCSWIIFNRIVNFCDSLYYKIKISQRRQILQGASRKLPLVVLFKLDHHISGAKANNIQISRSKSVGYLKLFWNWRLKCAQ